MKKNKVKSIIRESIYNLLNEYSSEQRLPFDDDKFKNKNYLEQYTDWLEDFGKYGKLPSSKMNFWDELRKAIQVIFSEDLRNREGVSLGDDDDDVERAFKELHEKIAPYLQFNSDGNVYVERAVQIFGSASSYDNSDENGKDPMQQYNSLVRRYNHNVGGCWAFRKGKAEAYCSRASGDIALFKGYIRVEDIDMVKTALLNYNQDEFEIRVNPNAKVELFEALLMNKSNAYKLPLRGTLIVSATYFGNGGEYEGKYAYIDDGFGKLNQFMDREGNIYSISSRLKDLLSQGKSFKDFTDEPGGIIWLISGGFYGLKIQNFLTVLNKHGDVFDNGNTLLLDTGDVSEGYLTIQRNGGEWTIINTDLKEICDWYRYVTPVHNGYATVQRDDGKWSIINTDGEQVCDWYRGAKHFVNGFAPVQRDDGKWAFINKEGQQISDWYRNIWPFYNGYAKVQRNDEKWSIINTDGEQVFDWFWNLDLDYNDNYIVTSKGDSKIINLQNKILLGPYSYIYKFSYKNEILLARRNDGKSALFNGRNYNQISDWYSSIDNPQSIYCDLILVKNENGMVSLINADGKQICDWYKHIKGFYHGFACVQGENGKWSFINTEGKQIGDWYYKVNDFKNGFATVQRDDGKRAFINTQGQQICDWYKYVHDFYDGFAIIERDDGKPYYMDTKGNLYDYDTKQPISVQNESYMRLSNLITEALHSSIRNYLLYN